ncbi:MAG TPA: hypothetical protein DCS85_00920, partial [Verrucomicrobiales bacterium]|nr:hypothetical protein [Verrucomicrobiales bacterium]
MIAGFCVFLVPWTVLAETSLLRQEQSQQRIGNSTADSAALLAELVDEFGRNGLEGTDVEILEGIQKVMGNVSGELMPEIVSQLNAARTGEDRTGRRARALSAYVGQKSASYQMRQVLLEYQRQLALYQLAERVQVLGDRQSANLHEAVALITASRKPSAARRQNDFAISRRLQETEQEALQKEVSLVLSALANMQKSFEGSLENRPGDALAFVAEHKLTAALQSAFLDLKSDRLMSAAGYQKSARDTLWRLVMILQPDRDPLDRLLAGLEKLDELIRGEKEVIGKTGDLDNRERAEAEELVLKNERVQVLEKQITDLERRLEHARPEQQVALTNLIENVQRRLEKEVERARERMGLDGPEVSDERRAERLQRDQAELVDRTDFLRQELSELVPEVADALSGSIAPMQEARAALGQSASPEARKEAALPPEKMALAALEKAREELLAEIEEAEFVEEVPLDKLEHLKELLEKVQDLKEGEKTIKAESAQAEQAGDTDQLKEEQAAAQEDLQEQAGKVAREAQSPAPEAARSIGEAAEQMEASQQALAKGENDPLAQQAALDALEQAEDQLQEQIAELEQAREDLEALQEIREKLDEVIAGQQEVQKDTIDEVAEPAEATSDKLAERQDQLGEQTSQLQNETQSPAPEAAQDLGQAAEAMEAAEGNLEQTNPLAAQPQQGEALESLQAAREKLDEKIAELQKQLGEAPGSDQASLEEALAAIEEAQEQVSEALAQLEPNAGALQELQARQEELADALQQAAQESGSPATAEAAGQAQPAAAQAAQQLGEGNLAGAIGEMQKAGEALGGEQGTAAQAREQGEIQELAEALGAGTQPAASPLQAANSEVSPLASGSQGSLPLGAQSALQSAQQSLADAAAQANAGNPSNSQSESQAAQASLSQAAAALSLAQAGLSPGEGQGQGQGQGQ